MGEFEQTIGNLAAGQEEIADELPDGRIPGSGPVPDFNGVAVAFGGSRGMSFEARCC